MLWKSVLPTVLILSLVTGTPVCGETVRQWQDGEFIDSDWELVSWYSPLDSGDSDATLAFTIAHAGNPGAHRAMGIGLGAGPDDGAMLVQLRRDWDWSPAIDGTITSLDLAVDFLQTNGAPVRLGIVVEQDGALYIHVLDALAAAASWTTYSAAGVEEAGFVPLDPAAAGHPDFTAGAPHLYFGFATGQLAAFAGEDSTFYHGVDNVDLTIHAATGTAVGETPGAGGPRALLASPNPFNPRTEFRFEMPNAGHVSLRIYDARGRLVRTLLDGPLAPGPQRVIWYGEDEAGRAAASGAYLAVVRTQRTSATTRVTLLQ